MTPKQLLALWDASVQDWELGYFRLWEEDLEELNAHSMKPPIMVAFGF